MNNKLAFLFLSCLFISACDLKNPIGLIVELWEEKSCMVLIPAGAFQMGSDIGKADEKPVNTVYVNAFYIDVYPVTNADYKKFIDANLQWRKDNIPRAYHDGDYLALWEENDYPIEKADHPVVYVSWYAAMAYAQWAEKRLPTEAEWEKAARGGLVEKKYPWGDTEDITKAGVQMWQSPARTTAVGTYPPNGYGLYDTAGNVWEWCLDGYNAHFYADTPTRNPIGSEVGTEVLIADFTNVDAPRVLRGGAWVEDPRMVRVAIRDKENPVGTFSLVGFRCVRDTSE